MATACELVDRDLYDQVSFKTQEFPRKLNPPGSVPVYGYKIDYSEIEPETLEASFEMDDAAAERGKKPYDIYCLVCHGADGKSNTKVALKMDVEPFDLTDEGTKELTDGDIFVKILASDAIMPKYRNELLDIEAWEITAYVRKLQK